MNKIKRLLRHDLPLHFVLLLTNWLPDVTFSLRLRGALAGLFLGSCGKNLRLGRDITFYNPSQIHIGNDVYIAKGCWFMAIKKITIGDEVLFGPYCLATTSNHQRHQGSFRYGTPQRAPISIGAGSWVAGHVVLSAGCTIGQGVLVAAQSVVTQDVDDHVMVAGQPARVVKVFEERDS